MTTTSVAAQSGGSTVVTAVVAPVRVIVVDDNSKITQVISNTPEAVAPTVHKNTADGRQLALTKDTEAQYTAILKHTNTHKAGVIYKANNGVGAKIQKLAEKISVASYPFQYSRS